MPGCDTPIWTLRIVCLQKLLGQGLLICMDPLSTAVVCIDTDCVLCGVRYTCVVMYNMYSFWLQCL